MTLPKLFQHDQPTRRSDVESLEGSFATRASSFVVEQFSIRGHPWVADEFRQGTVLGVTVNTLCNVMGAGILSLPLAMHNASIGVGLFLICFCCFGGSFATLFLAYGCQKTGRESYAEVVGYSVFSPDKDNSPTAQSRRRKLQLAVEGIIFLNNFGCLIIYARVIADSTPHVVQHFFQGGETSMWSESSTWYVISSIIFFILSCAKSMEELKWTSLLGVVTILYIVVVVLVRFFTMRSEPTYEAPTVRWIEMNNLSAIRALASLSAAFLYHPNVPYFYAELRNASPAAMMKTVGLSFPLILISYATTGVLGYLTFGDMVAAASAGGDIVNNYPTDDTFVNVGRFGLFFHFACVFPILSICARRALHRLLMAGLRSVAGALSTTPTDPELIPLPTAASTSSSSSQETKDPKAEEEEDLDSPEHTTWMAIVCEAAFLVSCSVFLAAVAPGISFVLEIIGTVFGITLMIILPGLVGIHILVPREPSEKDPQAYRYFSAGSTGSAVVSTESKSNHKVLRGIAFFLTIAGTCLLCVGLVSLVLR